MEYEYEENAPCECSSFGTWRAGNKEGVQEKREAKLPLQPLRAMASFSFYFALRAPRSSPHTHLADSLPFLGLSGKSFELSCNLSLPPSHRYATHANLIAAQNFLPLPAAPALHARSHDF